MYTVTWLFSTPKEWEEDRAQQRYRRRGDRHIQERDKQRWARDLEGFDLFELINTQEDNRWVTRAESRARRGAGSS
jgi:hypothetical protein